MIKSSCNKYPNSYIQRIGFHNLLFTTQNLTTKWYYTKWLIESTESDRVIWTTSPPSSPISWSWRTDHQNSAWSHLSLAPVNPTSGTGGLAHLYLRLSLLTDLFRLAWQTVNFLNKSVRFHSSNGGWSKGNCPPWSQGKIIQLFPRYTIIKIL